MPPQPVGEAAPETMSGPAMTGAEQPGAENPNVSAPEAEERIPERREDPIATPSRPDTPVAKPVPGRPGVVFSPYNNKPIDVKGIPSGKLVADPSYPLSEKKYFIVP